MIGEIHLYAHYGRDILTLGILAQSIGGHTLPPLYATARPSVGTGSPRPMAVTGGS